MSFLRLENVRTTLGQFTLEVNVNITNRVTGVFGPSGAAKPTAFRRKWLSDGSLAKAQAN